MRKVTPQDHQAALSSYLLLPGNPMLSFRSHCVFVWALLFAGLGSQLYASDNKLSANELMQRVFDNEIKAQEQDQSHWKYRSVSRASGKEYTTQVIETRQGSVDAVIAVDGHPLSSAERKKQEERIQKLADSPDAQRKQRHDSQQDAEKTKRLLKAFPRAVIASYGQQQGDLTELDFKPNPNFRPSSREEQVLGALAGKIWVNNKEDRLAQIEGQLTQTIKFGGGLLGHLDKGGEFNVKQTEVAPGFWELSAMHIEITGKALFFKTISVHEDEARSNFQPVSDNVTLAQAAEELRRHLATTTAIIASFD